MAALRPLYVLVGPTASGKTAAAIALARKISHGVIINMDALQLYRELPVLSAQPTAAEQAAAPHRLYGVMSGRKPASAAWWAERAKAELAACAAAAETPILCGGTGLYLKTLLEGIAAIPPVPPAVRAEATALLAEQGLAALYGALDAAMQAQLQPGDTQRIQRAWEVQRATGRSLADWQAQPRVGGLTGYDVRILALLPPRDPLYDKIDARFESMLAHGAVAEVQALLALSLPTASPVMKAVGVPELTAALRGELPLGEAAAQAAQASRRYAKRQYTWIRQQILPLGALPLADFGQNAGPALEKLISSIG